MPQQQQPADCSLTIGKITRGERRRGSKKGRLYRNSRLGGYYARAPRIYIQLEGERSIWGLVARWGHPARKYRPLLPQILSELGLPQDLDVHYSRTAGCSCGCSPGFILPKELLQPGEPGWDAWADVYVEEPHPLGSRSRPSAMAQS